MIMNGQAILGEAYGKAEEMLSVAAEAFNYKK
jgi:hypothetical protein